MVKKINENQIIQQLEIPESLRKIMVRIQDKMLDAIKKDGLDFETFKIPFPIGSKTLEKKEFIAYIISEWVIETKLIIDNLNMILDDMRLLGMNNDYFKGKPETRFYFLIRTFFYEFYRIKEILNIYFKVLLKNKIIDKETVDIMKDSIHDAFKETLIIRHNLVHSIINWNSREHIDLLLTSVNNERGYAVFDKKTGDEIKIQDILRNMTDQYINILGNEANRMRDVIQRLFNFFEEGIDYLASRLIP